MMRLIFQAGGLVLTSEVEGRERNFAASFDPVKTVPNFAAKMINFLKQKAQRQHRQEQLLSD